MENYRLYIDESGTHDYSKSNQLGKRYLAITGIAVNRETIENVLQPKVLELKKMFADDPDNLPVLHREEIVAKSGNFGLLHDPDVEKDFNTKFFELTDDALYTIFTVVLDKKSHFETYAKAAIHPYHYCLKVILERYVNFLRLRGTGDVMAESRGKIEDNALRQAYEEFYFRGTYFRKPDFIQSVLTSKKIKIKQKSKGIAGLEFADLLVLATKLDVLATYGIISNLDENFNKKLVKKLQPKYCRSDTNGKVKGYGKKIIACK